MPSLRILDLFSGIGGFSYAFHDIAKTVAYCEIDKNCTAVIEKNMLQGNIDEGVIFQDVTTLGKKELEPLRPNMITAGFPCQDLSSANPHGKGLKGDRSGLYKHIVRIIDEYPRIDYIFMENSPRILDKGFNIIASDMRKRGFSIKYCLINARDIGALHKRRRWYCLCYKTSAQLPLIRKNIYNWETNPKVHKVVELRDYSHKKTLRIRNEMLGNSIVPDCAAYAYNSIINSISKYPHEKRKRVFIKPYKIVPPQNLVFQDGTTTKYADYWATPCHGNWHNYTKIYDRGIRLLSSQLFYHVDTKVKDQKTECYDKYMSNPLFVEFLMGYPKNWTKT